MLAPTNQIQYVATNLAEPFRSNPSNYVALPQLTDCCNYQPHRATRISLRRTLPLTGQPAPPFSSRVRLHVPVAFVSATRFARTGVTSVAVLGCSLSTMTSHPLAVPKPNQLIVTTCDLYTFVPSIASSSSLSRLSQASCPPSVYPSGSFLRLRHKS